MCVTTTAQLSESFLHLHPQFEGGCVPVNANELVYVFSDAGATARVQTLDNREGKVPSSLLNNRIGLDLSYFNVRQCFFFAFVWKKVLCQSSFLAAVFFEGSATFTGVTLLESPFPLQSCACCDLGKQIQHQIQNIRSSEKQLERHTGTIHDAAYKADTMDIEAQRANSSVESCSANCW